MKYEIARELGLLDKVLESGWRTLTAKETGRIGGLVTKRKREASADKAEKRQKSRKNYRKRKRAASMDAVLFLS